MTDLDTLGSTGQNGQDVHPMTSAHNGLKRGGECQRAAEASTLSLSKITVFMDKLDKRETAAAFSRTIQARMVEKAAAETRYDDD